MNCWVTLTDLHSYQSTKVYFSFLRLTVVTVYVSHFIRFHIPFTHSLYACLRAKGFNWLLTHKAWVLWSVFLRSPVLCLVQLDNQKVVNASFRWHNESTSEWTCITKSVPEKDIPAGIGPLLLFLYTQQQARSIGKRKRDQYTLGLGPALLITRCMPLN